MIGAKIYTLPQNINELFKEWQSLEFDTIFINSSLYSNLEFRKLAKQYNMTTFIIFPVFYNPDVLQEKPELYSVTNKGDRAVEEWLEFVCPTREEYSKTKIEEIVKIVTDLNPDGLSLDFIRYFVFWEKIYYNTPLDSIPNSCFCAHCLEKFQKDTSTILPKEIVERERIVEFILGNLSREWTDWKCEVITSIIKEISDEVRKIKPEILISVHVIPWKIDDYDNAIRRVAGQDLNKIAKIVDFISPMCYSHMLKRDPSWINTVVKGIHEQTKNKVVPSIQVEKCYLDSEISSNEFYEMIKEAVKDPSDGIIFWSWDSLQKNNEKKKISGLTYDIMKESRE